MRLHEAWCKRIMKRFSYRGWVQIEIQKRGNILILYKNYIGLDNEIVILLVQSACAWK
jgi:hypothetical protein